IDVLCTPGRDAAERPSVDRREVLERLAGRRRTRDAVDEVIERSLLEPGKVAARLPKILVEPLASIPVELFARIFVEPFAHPLLHCQVECLLAGTTPLHPAEPSSRRYEMPGAKPDRLGPHRPARGAPRRSDADCS